MSCECENNIISFETYKETHNLDKAEREQRILEWLVSEAIRHVEQGRVSAVEDMIGAYIGLKYDNVANNINTIKNANWMLQEIGKRGYVEIETQIRWKLQKYL